MEMKPGKELVYCRLCLVSEEFLAADRYVCISTDKKLPKRISEIFGFNPNSTRSRRKNFSLVLCPDCHERVNSIADFIESVRKNQKKLEDVVESELLEKVKDLMNVKQEEEEMQVDYLDHDFDNTDVMSVKDFLEDGRDEEKPFVCHYCSKPFKLKASLTEHMSQEHIKDQQYQCESCPSMFLSLTDLAQHQKELHKRRHRFMREIVSNIDKYLFCELCEHPLNFESFKDLTDHYQIRHGTRGYVRCCSKQFFTRKSVVNHSDVHSNPTDYMCKICQKLLPDKYTLRDHILRHNPDEERKFECDYCQKKFHVQKDLADHINRLHRCKVKKDERETCVLCDKSFVSKYSLMTHNRRFHMNLERPICETCGKECRSKADLSAHIKARHTDTPRQKCDICGNYVKYLQKHKQIHIESELHIKCDICGLETSTYKYLRLHMKIHTDEKPYECTTCGTAFKRKNALEDHMSIHSGIPRHFCNFCDRTFNNSGNKSKHMKHVHAQELAELNKRNQKIEAETC